MLKQHYSEYLADHANAPAAALRLLSSLLGQLIKSGRLTVIDSRGRISNFGPDKDGSRVTVRMRGPTVPLRILLRPSLALGEAYMDGTITIEDGTLRDLLRLCTSNLEVLDRNPIGALRGELDRLLRRFHQDNRLGRARANIAHHYDLSGELYDLFLDHDRQYSCAYFQTGIETLEEAQDKQKRHIMAKLLLKPGMRVLDIGSGWGGLALEMARTAGADVTGLTLSREQLVAAGERAVAAGLSSRVRFAMRDYREVQGTYDRIVSVGMFEHVGVAHYRTYFDTLRQRLSQDGVALVHAIGRADPPGSTDPWLRKYIFPGGYCPALSEVLAAVERSGLWVTDIEILRLHYAETLRHWFERFQTNRERAKLIYDERFCRMWEFYLAGSEAAFRNGPKMVFQMQLARRRDAAPLTRDYIADWERSGAGATKIAS
ncbi:MAG: class I SAM-dependent methyltransferase [Hyphomicrobiaceae bacterium]